MAYYEVSDRGAVLKAIKEWDSLGKTEFLLKHGFQAARNFFLVYKKREYASKAILAVAHFYQFGKRLRYQDFSGGRATVQPVLEAMGFQVIEKKTKQRSTAPGWSDEEIRASVKAYFEMWSKLQTKEPFKKKSYYAALSVRFGRTPAAFEFRMQNISYVLSIMGRQWIPGLPPAKHVGVRTAGKIEDYWNGCTGLTSTSLAEFEEQVTEERQRIARGGSSGTKVKAKLPSGKKIPIRVTATITSFVRDAKVKAWVLERANGKCECCKKRAPFIATNGFPFLEVHHLWQLADGGSDCVDNAAAVCPNCHREMHYGVDAKAAIAKVRAGLQAAK